MNTDERRRSRSGQGGMIRIDSQSAATTDELIENAVSSMRLYLTRRWTPTQTAKRGDDEKEDDGKKDERER